MSMTQQRHDPDPEFVARLENELTTEYRRLERLGPIDWPRRTFIKWLRGAGFAVAGLLLGAASVTMAQRLDDARTAELLQRIAAGRVDLSRQIAAETRQRTEAGVLPTMAAYPAQIDVIEAELQLALAELDIEEVRADGRPVRNDIAAPRIDGRDFVSERLQLELGANSERMALLQRVIDFQEVRVRAGVDVTASLRPFTTERDELAAAAAQIGGTLMLRQSFLAGDIDAEEADLRHRRLLATTRLQVANTRVDALRAENELRQRRISAGLTPSSDALAAEIEQQRAEAEADVAQMEVDLITAELNR